MTLDLALGLAGVGFHVLPVKHGEDNTKTPLTKHGHLDATNDTTIIEEWWKKHPDAKVGVVAGKSGLNILDVDVKNGKDGWDSLATAWLEIPDTYSYDTDTGGSHLVFKAPGTKLNGVTNYRGMDGVDRRAGSSWVMWVGDIPDTSDIVDAPEWLNDTATERKVFEFEGDLQDWYDKLIPGEPNVLVRNAMNRIKDDMAHSEMVSAQHEAIRLGAEGNPGVPELLDALREAWENRPAENHTTPEDMWGFKFEEALHRGFTEFGGLIEQLQNLQDYNIAKVPAEISDVLLTQDTGKPGFSKLLGALVKATADDNLTASILWGAPATKELAREWGLLFVHKRIEGARITPEPTRENPRVEEAQEQERVKPDLTKELLTDDERAYIAKRPTFVDYYVAAGKTTGFANETYFRASAWQLASMAFAYRGYFPVTETDRMGLTLWNIMLGESGTGKTRALKFRDEALRKLFDGDSNDIQYNLGADSSIQGLHESLLQRDGAPSFFAEDEASGFFAQLKSREGNWLAGMTDVLSRWYEGYVEPSSKIRLKELKGQSASTQFNMHMTATPGRFLGLINRDMFLSGFMARTSWAISDPPVVTDARFDVLQVDDANLVEFDETPAIIQDVVANLVDAISFTKGRTVPLKLTEEARLRLSEAHKRMYRVAEGAENWDIIEPAITRLAETMRKCAGICALYRSDSTVNIDDVLHAINATEEWFKNLFTVAGEISDGDFQRDCREIETWVSSRGGNVSRSRLFHRFRNMIVKDKRELDSKVDFLVESGILNRRDENGGIIYELNGSI